MNAAAELPLPWTSDVRRFLMNCIFSSAEPSWSFLARLAVRNFSRRRPRAGEEKSRKSRLRVLDIWRRLRRSCNVYHSFRKTDFSCASKFLSPSITLRRYDPIGTFRRFCPLLAGVTNKSVLKEVAVTVESVRARGVAARVTVNAEEAEASDKYSSATSEATRIEESKNSSREGRSTSA